MKRSVVILVWLGILSVLFSQTSFGQFLGNSVEFSGRGTFALGVEGTYSASEWEPVSLTSKGGLARLTFGVDNGLDIFLLGGERDFLLSENKLGLENVQFPFDYVAGAGFRLRFFRSKSGLFSLHAFASGLYFNPQTSFDTPLSGKPVGRIRRSFVSLEGFTPQSGFSSVISFSHVNAFVGVFGRYHHYKTNRKDWILSSESAVLVREESSIQESPVQMVLSLGLEFKLPYNYRISFEMQNSSLSELSVMAGLSQIGSP
ncbi:MAG: hypothetical protein GXO76_07800 [Calditrichaeota bacterium]|nr:hypothetical protein [Calditrichota bacterium]